MAEKDEKDGKDGNDGSTDGWAGFEERLEEIRESLHSPGAPQPRRARACDRALRWCAAELARPGGHPAHGCQLTALALEAAQLHLRLQPEPPELYLERILFHVLRNAAPWVGPPAWAVAELLRARLRHCRRRHRDWAAVARGAFGVLWRCAAAVAGPERPREEGRAVLTARIRSLRFLLLLESHQEQLCPRESFQPPLFTSQSAQHAAAAAALYEAQRAPCPLFLARQLQELLLDTLRDESPKPPSLQDSLCFLELTLERCRHLCKARRPRDALEALEGSRRFLEGAGSALGAPLELLEAGIQLSQALQAKAAGAVGPALRRAGAALAAECSGRFLKVLLESSQLVLGQLGEVLRRGRELPLGLQELPGICGFCQGHGRALRRLLAQVPADSIRDQVALTQLLFQGLQLFSNAIHEIFQRCQPSEGPELAQVTSSCVQSVTWMLQGLQGLPEAERGKFLDVTAAVAARLGQALQSRNVPEAAGAVCEPLCRAVLDGHGYSWAGVTPERLHRCFRLQVQSWRCQGRPERALDTLAQWLLALGTGSQGSGTPSLGLGTPSLGLGTPSQPVPGQPSSLVAELVALWARIKTEAAKQGAEELRLRTLRDALESQSQRQPPCGDALLQLLLAELQAYKGLRGPTGPERYNVLCDLLGLWDPEGSWDPPGAGEPGGNRSPPGTPDPNRSLPRAVALLELGQLLCNHSFSAYTECSALDAIHESLRLLESLAQNSQICNSQMRDQLLDEHAQALLWLHICTLEALLEKSVARDRRGRDQEEPQGEPDGIRCSLGSDRALCKPLDEAFSLWKKLLEHPGVPSVRSPEQTLSSLQLLAALYRLQDRPLQALQSSRLLLALCRRLGDAPGAAEALSRICRSLLELGSAGQAQVFLEELEFCLEEDEGPEDSRLLLRHSRLLLRSQLCCLQKKADQGVPLLLQALREPQAPRPTRSWFLAQAQALQVLASFLELPPAHLEAPTRELIRQQGWSSPQVALLEAQKLLRSVLVSLMGSEVLGSARGRPPEEPGPDCGPALVHKWQVLGDALGCCQRLVTLLGHCEVLCRARAFCGEGLTMAGHLQAARRCAWFLVLQSQLELQQGELELSQSHLQHAQFLLQPQTDPKPLREPRPCRARIQLRKGPLDRRRPLEPVPAPVPGGDEDEEFLKGPSLALLAPAALPEQPDALTASPELKESKAWKSLEFLSHPSGCPCSFCRDPALVALGLRWLLAQARTWLVAGEVAPGLALVRRVLPRCASAGTRLARELWGVGLGDTGRDRDRSVPDPCGDGDTIRDRDRSVPDPSGNGDIRDRVAPPGNGDMGRDRDRSVPDPSENGDMVRNGDRNVSDPSRNGDIIRNGDRSVSDLCGNGDMVKDGDRNVSDPSGNGDTIRDRTLQNHSGNGDMVRNGDRSVSDPSGNGDIIRNGDKKLQGPSEDGDIIKDKGIPGNGDIRDRSVSDPSGNGDMDRSLQNHSGNGDTFRDKGIPEIGDRNQQDPSRNKNPSGNGDIIKDRDISGDRDVLGDRSGQDLSRNGDTIGDRDLWDPSRDRDPSGNGDTIRNGGTIEDGDTIRNGDTIGDRDPSGDGDTIRNGDPPGDGDTIRNGDTIGDRDPLGDRDPSGNGGTTRNGDPPGDGDTIRNGDTIEDGDTIGDRDPLGDSPPGPLAELVAAGYSVLALQSLASPSQCPPVWDEELERGLTLLGSLSPPVSGLGVAVATLLLAKAVATLGRVAAALGHSMDEVLAQAWTPRPPPTPNPAKPQKTPKAPPKTGPQKAKPPKTKAGKTPKVKPPKFGDVFTLGDSDPEVPPIVLRPGGPCTPHPKLGVPPKALLGGPGTPFTIFSEEPSPPGGRSRIRGAPKIPARVKSRIRVTFSDSDPEEPQNPPDPPKTTQKSSCAKRRIQPQKSPRNSPGIGARTRRGRPRKELGTPKKREKRGIKHEENVENVENDIPQIALEKRERRGNSRVENVEKMGNPNMENVGKTGNPNKENVGKRGNPKMEKPGDPKMENVEKMENPTMENVEEAGNPNMENLEKRGIPKMRNVEKTRNPKMENVEKPGNPKMEKVGKRGDPKMEKTRHPKMENVEKTENPKMENAEKTENPKTENAGKRGNSKMENVEKKEKGKPKKPLEKKENRGPHRAGGPREKKERGKPQSGILEEKRNWEFCGIEERDPLRAVEEEEEEEEEMSFELPPLPPGGASTEMPGIGDKGDPPNPEGPQPCARHGVPSLTAVRSLLAEALAWLGRCPPGSVYARLCQLLALALGDRDPLGTAGLLAESLGVTLRHQLLAIVHARARKKRKAAAAAGGDISDQLRGLSLDSQDSQNPQDSQDSQNSQDSQDSQNSQDSQDSQSHLAELEELFQFGSAGLGPAHRERFREQLQRIPSGVTVCQLSLVSATPGALGDTLLLTRLERGQEPVSVRIATGRCQAPLSGILREFERIQQEQREANACTERQQWWERRSRLDLRMQSLIQSLDSEVLGCWRGLLLPRDPENSPLDEQELSQLLQELQECGWECPEPALLRVLLSVLSPADARAVAAALCPARPLRARLLLDEALERRRESAGGSAGSLVLLLDRHLQRLPWESSGTLRNVPVTRLPGLRFLLRYGMGQQRSGSVLSRGVNPKNAFYVLNPQRDLGGTEERFRAWFESEPGWRGVSGAAPTPQQLQEALGERDLYIYAGHGAGARLLDGQSLARLPCRAVVLLFGCSSAALAPRGALEPSGTVLKFVLAGCPLVLGNLWDVTDRDLDRLAQALLRGWLGGGPGTPLLGQLAQARQAPRLKWLIGAAPVAYGLPVSLC